MMMGWELGFWLFGFQAFKAFFFLLGPFFFFFFFLFLSFFSNFCTITHFGFYFFFLFKALERGNIQVLLRRGRWDDNKKVPILPTAWMCV